LIGKALLLGFKCLPDTILQHTVDQKTQDHEHHSALRGLMEQGMRHKEGIFQETKPPLPFLVRTVVSH
jgi:hypothetical protein